MHKFGLFVAALLLLMTPSPRAQKKSSATSARPSGSSTWVESTLKRMTLREKLGQMLMPYYFGVFTSTESTDYKQLLHQVKENHVGGFILGTVRGPLGLQRSQVYPTAVIMNELQKQAEIPLLIGADFESGTSMRLDEGTSFPSAMAIAAAGDPKFAYDTAKIVALESRAAGIHWVFAPDADVNDNPENPIINIRSFGEDPRNVAEYVAQFTRGLEDNGVLSTAKHFPGQGNAASDSHLSLAIVPSDRAKLESIELVPFRAAIGAGVSSVMPGHIAAPAIEPDAALPATVSPKILGGLLRGDMKFRGLIVTDAMDMGGVTSLYPQGEAAVRAVEAGADVILQPLVPDAALAGLESAIKSGRISTKRIDESVRRILAAKARLGLDKNRLVEVSNLNSKFGLPEYAAAAQKIADRGVTLLRDPQHLLPLDATRPLRLLLVSLSADPDPYPGEDLQPELRWRADSLQALRADTLFAGVASLKLPPPESYDVAVAALFVRVTDRKGSVGLPEDQCAFVNQLLAAGKPTVVVAFGSPYLIERFPNAKTWLAEFSTNEVSQLSVARALFGQTAISGKIPVTVPGAAKRGDGLSVAANPMTLEQAPASLSGRLKPAFDLLDRAAADGAFPGGILAVGLQNQLVLHPFGKLSSEKNSSPVNSQTIYDLASLTKPIVTTTAAMLLVQQKQLDLDAPASRYLPEFAAAAKSDPDPAWRARVTVRMLLLHDSGLPAHREYYKTAKGHDAVLSLALAEPLLHEPGARVEYSDVGFILLGEIIQRITGQSLDVFAERAIFTPLGMKDSMFNPPRKLRNRIAPTEDDTTFRKQLVWGEVHDQNAWAMGGVAGQAGMFSTASDVAAFAQMILNGGIYGHARVLARATISQFTSPQTIGNGSRTLGWDVALDPAATGRYFSPRSFGHYGYTGTSLWIDPERGLFIVLLTNRVNPTVENIKIRQVRPALHDAIFEALGLAAGHAAAR
ncbi:MAG TPA: glycoside hydrolase family 3 N-terminal domain-containing protein [Candidatus Sulfotelmatobacter sp.]|nr:glycoside hydrolase family 3 N-terminal domain-containing protein [Candidatus Sulfotelmatobacter sp.]